MSFRTQIDINLCNRGLVDLSTNPRFSIKTATHYTK